MILGCSAEAYAPKYSTNTAPPVSPSPFRRAAHRRRMRTRSCGPCRRAPRPRVGPSAVYKRIRVARFFSVRSKQDPVLLQAFVAEIKARRPSSALSQEALVFASGVGRTFVAKLELGQMSPSRTTIFRLAEGLDIALDEMIRSTMKRYRNELRSSVYAK